VLQKRLEEALAGFDGKRAFKFEDFVKILLKGGSVGEVSLLPRQQLNSTSQADTSRLICGLSEDERKLVVAFTNYVCFPLSSFSCSLYCFSFYCFFFSSFQSVLDFATSLNNWYNAKVGNAMPTVGSAAFVKLMTTQLKLADQVGDELQMKGEHKAAKITLTFVRNNSSKTWSFKNTFRGETPLSFEKLEAFFNEHVEVKFIDTSNWTPQWSNMAAAMANTGAVFQEYMDLAGEKDMGF
jgi:hypothetical protein